VDAEKVFLSNKTSMSYTEDQLAKDLENQEYKFGFVTNIESDQAPKGLNEDIIRFISEKKEEPTWLLEYRLTAFKAWQGMTEPEWAHVTYEKPNFQLTENLIFIKFKF
jgi:Fe-S cluster assembly protein SufB